MKRPTDLTTFLAPDANYTYGRYKDESAEGANDGTTLSADLNHDWFYAMASVIDAHGSFSGTTENLNATTPITDFRDALYAMLKSSQNPFINYALFQERVTASVNSTIGWNDRLITVQENNISGVSESSSEIVLPAGQYRVKGYGCFWDVDSGSSSAKVALYNVTTSTFQVGSSYIFGSSAAGRDSDGDKTKLCGTFTLTGTTTISLRQYSTSAYTGGLGLHVATGETGDYTVVSELEIWKLD